MTTEQYEQIIAGTDLKIKLILQKNNDDQQLLALMLDDMPKIKKVMNSVDNDQMNRFCLQYENFHYYVKLLEKLAAFVAKPVY